MGAIGNTCAHKLKYKMKMELFNSVLLLSNLLSFTFFFIYKTGIVFWFYPHKELSSIICDIIATV